jgi:acid phosphatase (class A)
MPNTWIVVAGTVGVGAVSFGLYKVQVPWRGAPPSATVGVVTKLGYLSPAELPNMIALLPPPPAPGSETMKADEIARTAAIARKGTPRYALAVAHANREHGNTVNAFQCAFGAGISAERTPRLYRLLARLRLDVRAASYPAKMHFKRPRPFTVHRTRTCYADDEAMASGDWSYPSARGAVGWAYALVLADLRPNRADTILKRARDFGESRVICDQEWASDIEGGRTVAAAMVEKLKTDQAFKVDFAAARDEVAMEIAEGIRPALDCPAERTALASR